MALLNRSVLVLNATFEPIRVCSARRAFTLVLKGAACVEEVSTHVVHTDKMNIPIPNVIRLLKYRRVPRSTRAYTRKGIMLRDGFTCQYCGQHLAVGDLTIDHVVPLSRCGQTTYENTVVSCKPCNNKKGNRTPDEAGMPLSRQPRQLSMHAKTRLLQGDESSWEKYLYV